jgi:hypothetical protein
MENIIRVNAGNEYLKILESLPRGWDKDAHYHLFCLIYIWMKLLGFGSETKIQYFKELIFNTLLFADDQLIIADTEDNFQRAVYLSYSISNEYNL